MFWFIWFRRSLNWPFNRWSVLIRTILALNHIYYCFDLFELMFFISRMSLILFDKDLVWSNCDVLRLASSFSKLLKFCFLKLYFFFLEAFDSRLERFLLNKCMKFSFGLAMSFMLTGKAEKSVAVDVLIK